MTIRVTRTQEGWTASAAGEVVAEADASNIASNRLWEKIGATRRGGIG